ncbi:MAG: hypothetical protein OHM77_02225 [Candidatus Nitricoxidivorans perseverans]|uniref:Uncharacterized protein n=1 Tax=Candidatus Nitricoxidivorans perseverans TaxID=2975601 RepID=A0AA49IWJ1_9PROT|nr:MAG: hypothetical protein OHM77_02225 [Candidatus Nitricoxidivorans perseverans]
MPIRLIESISIDGIHATVDGATLSLPPPLEVDLVNKGRAAWVVLPSVDYGYRVSVGDGGRFTNLYSARDWLASQSLNADVWGEIVMLPGVYTLDSSELALPDYCTLSGMNKRSCIVNASGNFNIRIGAHTRLERFRLNYTGTGNRSGGIRPQDSVQDTSDEFLDISELDINVYGTNRSAIWIQNLINTWVHNSRIVTSGIGIEAFDGHVFISGTHCRMVAHSPGNTNPHYAILRRGSRVWVDGGTWATGYGEPNIVGEPDADIVAFRDQASVSGRLELNNVWSICRNESGANPGVKIACVDVAASAGWVRCRGGYFQAEDGGANVGNNYDLMNSGGGRLEIQGARYKSLSGNSYSANGGGVRVIAGVATYTPQYNDDGLKIVDATGQPGGVTVYLSGSGKNQVVGARQTIIRRDSTGFPITIHGNTRKINGAASRSLGAAQWSRLELRYAGDDGWVVTSE